MEKIFIVGEGFIGEHLCRYFTEKYSKDKVIYFTDTKLKIIDKENYNICDINSIFKYNSIDCIVNSLEDMEFIQKVTKISNINQYHQIMTKKIVREIIYFTDTGTIPLLLPFSLYLEYPILPPSRSSFRTGFQ